MTAEKFELTPQMAQWPESVPREGICDRIYGRGSVEALEGPCLAVVGARRGTPYGVSVAALAGRLAAEAGIVVVSGGAMGADAAAARAALKAGGRIVVVAGTGADRVYPASSRDVFEGALASGAVVALEPWGSPPRRYAFPKRNRLIAALGLALVVTEAGLPSGTFSTADAALALGRPIYAAPGSMFSPFSRGANRLIEQGATILVDESSLEMAISLDFGVLRRKGSRPLGQRDRLLSALVAQPLRVEELACHLGTEVLATLRQLSDYEVQGLVARLPDGRFTAAEGALLP